ncbi:MAG: alpha/beta hydrolase [Lautropia sp.]|nr:alpha/beta hydrolase [Lautropia sp.]
MTDVYREQLLQLGGSNHLVATLTVPLKCALRALNGSGARSADTGNRDRRVGVLLLNAGVIHRIGPHRINVKMARRLAQAGLPSIRLDLSGLGDSARAGGTESMLEQARQDIRAALDQLAARSGVSRFVIMGICSGAEYAYQYAEQDTRVCGLVMVDGYSFPTRRTRFLRYGLRLKTLTWPVLRNALQGRLKRWRERSAGTGADPSTPVDYGLPNVTVQAFAEGLAARVQRGCRIYLVFTGSILQRYNYANQFRDAMAQVSLRAAEREAVARVRCDFVPEIDHTLSTLAGQRLFIARTGRWLFKDLLGKRR